MTKTNIFSGIKIKFRVVDSYRKTKHFDHFVFQQAIFAEGPEGGNQFTLVVYARTKYLTVLNNGKPIACEEIKTCDFTGTKPIVQFANMKLNTVGLEVLYPPDQTSDLTVCATGYYDNGAYVQYTASTAGHHDVPIQLRIEPSPPA